MAAITFVTGKGKQGEAPQRKGTETTRTPRLLDALTKQLFPLFDWPVNQITVKTSIIIQ